MVSIGGGTFRSVREMGNDAPKPPAPAPVEFRPIGGDPTAVKLLSSMEGTLSSVAAATQEVHNLSKEFQIVNDRQMRMVGTAVGELAESQRAIVDAYKEAIAEQTETLVAALPRAIRGDPVSVGDGVPNAPDGPRRPNYADDPRNPYQYPEGSPTGSEDRDPVGESLGIVPNAPSGSRRRSPASTGDVDRTERMRDGVEEPRVEREPLTPQQEYERRRDYLGTKGGKFSLKNLRQDLGARVEGRLENATWGEQLEESPIEGLWHLPSTEEGSYGPIADEGAVKGYLRREKIMGAARGAAQTVARGGSLKAAGLGAIPGAAKVLGTAGLAATAVDKIGDFAEGQRAANAQYQRISGGSNFDSFAERGREQMFGWSQFGTMGSGDAQRLYREVAATGMDSDDRGTAQSFAVNNYKQFGMTIAQSMEIVKTASQTGQESLLGVSRALKDVTESASEAGVNAEVARQKFVDTWQSFSETFQGPAAVVTASAFTQAQMGLGRQYEDMDFSGTGSEQVMRMVAASNGETYNQLLAKTMEPGGQAAYVQDWQNFATDQVGFQMGEAGQAIVDEAVANRRDPSKFNESERTQVAQRMLNELPGMDLPTLIRTMEGMTGISGLDERDALGYFADFMAGDFDPAAEAEEAWASGQTQEIERYETEGEGPLGEGGVLSDEYQSWLSDFEEDVYKPGKSLRGDNTARETARDFMSDVRKTGRTGGISEALVTSGKGIYADVKKVQVETTGGPRVVGLQEAMRDFRDQIDAGTALVVEGNKEGATISEAVGVVGDEDLAAELSAKGEYSAENEDLAEAGEAVEDFDGSGGDGGGGTVRIEAQPWLEEAFRFMGSGNVRTPGQDLRPPPAHVTPGSRPSGNPRP